MPPIHIPRGDLFVCFVGFVLVFLGRRFSVPLLATSILKLGRNVTNGLSHTEGIVIMVLTPNLPIGQGESHQLTQQVLHP